MSQTTRKVKIHPSEDGGFWAEAVDLPGCVTEGATLDEIKPRILEAIEAWLGHEIDPAGVYMDIPVSNVPPVSDDL